MLKCKARILLIYVLFAVIIIVILYGLKKHNFYKRAVRYSGKCPFKKGEDFEVIEKFGEKEHDGIVSAVLYGYPDKDRYLLPLYKSIENVNKYLPEWQVRVYISPTIPTEVVKNILERDAQIHVVKPSPKGHEASAWRFLAAMGDTPFVSVDADDIFSEKDAKNIKKWLKSRKPFYIKTSTPIAHMFIPLQAGSWGCLPYQVPNIKEKFLNYCDTQYGGDEIFLNNEVWPIAKRRGYYNYKRPQYYIILLVIISIVILFAYILIKAV